MKFQMRDENYDNQMEMKYVKGVIIEGRNAFDEFIGTVNTVKNKTTTKPVNLEIKGNFPNWQAWSKQTKKA